MSRNLITAVFAGIAVICVVSAPAFSICPKGMAKVNDQACIDLYEFPNQDGEMPNTGASWYDAKSSCESIGKRLCTESEWEQACFGMNEARYPYGEEYIAEKCNEIDPIAKKGVIKTSGDYLGCMSDSGAFDMVGNVWEWVEYDYMDDGIARLKGGSAIATAYNPMTCTTTYGVDREHRAEDTGFRCCMNMPESTGTPVSAPKKEEPASSKKPEKKKVEKPAGEEVAEGIPGPVIFALNGSYYVPAEGSFDNAPDIGAFMEFRISDSGRLRLMYNHTPDGNCSAGTNAATTNTCEYSRNLAGFTLIRRTGRKDLFYFGVGAAWVETHYSLDAVMGANRYQVTSNPDNIGGLLLMGYGGDTGPFIEGNYFFTDNQSINPLITDSLDMSGGSITAGYRLLVQ